MSINVSINCGDPFVCYPFQLSGLADSTRIILLSFHQPLQFLKYGNNLLNLVRIGIGCQLPGWLPALMAGQPCFQPQWMSVFLRCLSLTQLPSRCIASVTSTFCTSLKTGTTITLEEGHVVFNVCFEILSGISEQLFI